MKSPASLFLLLFLVLCRHQISAQSAPAQDSTHQWISLGFSSLAYRGDLGGNFSKWTSGFYAGLQFNTHKKFSGSLNLLAGRISGQDLSPVFNVDAESGRTPNTYFNASITSVYYQLLWHAYKGKQLRIFVGQGVGLIRYDPKNEEGISFANQNNTRAANETYGTLTVLAPTSIGASWKFKNNFGLAYRLNLLNTATDYLDNISQLGTQAGRDNVLGHQLSLMIPVKM